MTRRRSAVICILIFAVALVVGTHNIGRYSFWDDEGFSVAAAHLHFTKIFSFTAQRDPHTGFFHLLLHFWVALNGDGEAWVRFMSSIFAAGAAAALWIALRRVFANVVAIGATALFVLNGFYVAYAQEARPYAMAEFFTCVAMALFITAVQTQRKQFWFGWSVAAALAVYCHPFAVFPIVAAHISLLVAPQRPKLKLWLGTVAAQIVLCAPLAVMVSTQSVSHLSWVEGLSISTLGGAASHVTGYGGYGMTAFVSLLIAVFLVQTVRSLIKRQKPWPETLVLLWALLLPFGLVGLSIFKHVLVSRYLIPALPGVMTAVVVVVYSFKDSIYRYGSAVLVTLFALVSVNTYYTHGAKDDWRDAALYVRQNAQPGDAIIISYEQRNVFQYYFEKDGGVNGSPPTPLSPSRPWGSAIPVHEVYVDESSPVSVARAVAPYERVWLLDLDAEPHKANLLMGLHTVYPTVHEELFKPRVEAVLYSTNPTSFSNP